MHPLNNRYFGSGDNSIAILFWNGSAIVSGYIVKQLGTILTGTPFASIGISLTNDYGASVVENIQITDYCNDITWVTGASY